ncbi:MAG: HAD-IIIA family hydrolase [Legionellales bacterium]|nr:HAD-IIIA family hydrolase [Legionellales bacterium]
MQELLDKFAKIRLLICDVDGVLTDGKLYYNEHGIAHKAFHVQDGLGLQLCQQHGIDVAIITTCKSPLTRKRFSDLGIQHLYMGNRNKFADFQDLLAKTQLSAEQCAYIGDDLLDLKIIKHCGLGITVADGHPLVKEFAHYVTQQAGGNKAVREVCDLLLEAQGKLAALIDD